jgi:hypothetical protein
MPKPAWLIIRRRVMSKIPVEDNVIHHFMQLDHYSLQLRQKSR